MNRNDVTEMIIEAKVRKVLKWEDVAREVGMSKEWVTAGCLGQMTFDATQADAVARIFELPADARKWLQEVPYRGSGIPTVVKYSNTTPSAVHVRGALAQLVERRLCKAEVRSSILLSKLKFVLNI